MPQTGLGSPHRDRARALQVANTRPSDALASADRHLARLHENPWLEEVDFSQASLCTDTLRVDGMQSDAQNQRTSEIVLAMLGLASTAASDSDAVADPPHEPETPTAQIVRPAVCQRSPARQPRTPSGSPDGSVSGSPTQSPGKGSPTRGAHGPRPIPLRGSTFISPQELRQQLQAKLPVLAAAPGGPQPGPCTPTPADPAPPRPVDAPCCPALRRSSTARSASLSPRPDPASPTVWPIKPLGAPSPSSSIGSSPRLGSLRGRPGAAGPAGPGDAGVAALPRRPSIGDRRPSISDPLPPSRERPRARGDSLSPLKPPPTGGVAEALSPPRAHVNPRRHSDCSPAGRPRRRHSGVDPLSSLRRQSATAPPNPVLPEDPLRTDPLFAPARDNRCGSPLLSFKRPRAHGSPPATRGLGDGSGAACPAKRVGAGGPGDDGAPAPAYGSPSARWNSIAEGAPESGFRRSLHSPLVSQSWHL